MIDRYIYAVTKELPAKTRNEIGSEITALIDDMMETMDSTLSEEAKTDKVLRELGNPKEFANRYRGKDRYLIGPKYIDEYIFILKIVASSIFIGITIASSLGVMFSIQSITEMLGGYLSALFSGVLQGVAWVTGIFALLEYKGIPVETGWAQKEWEPSLLLDLPHKKALIPRGESIFSIIINTLILTSFFFAPERIGLYFKSGSQPNFMGFFNLEELVSLKLIIIAVFTINMLIEVIKIIYGRWTTKIAIIITALNIVSAALFITFLYNMNIWNSEIVRMIEQYTPVSLERIVLLTVATIIIVTIAESSSALYKGYRYGRVK